MEQRFDFKYDWYVFIENLDSETLRLNMYKAIVNYGLDSKLPQDFMTEEMKQYFDQFIKPELDRQNGIQDFREGN